MLRKLKLLLSLSVVAAVARALPWDYTHLAETLGSMYEFGAGGLPGKVFVVLGESAADRGPLLQLAKHLRYPVLCIDIDAALKRHTTPAEAATDIKRWLVNNLAKPSMISVANAHKVDGSTLEAFNFLHEVTDSSNSMIHYTNPTTLETLTASTKGSVFVLHVELPQSYTCDKDELYGLWQDAVMHRTTPDALYGRIENAFCAEHPRASIGWQGICDRSYPSAFGFDGSSGSMSTLVTAVVAISAILSLGVLVLRSSTRTSYKELPANHYMMSSRNDAPEPPESDPSTPMKTPSKRRQKPKAATMPVASPTIERPVTRSITKRRGSLH